jgi:sugar/nucleoside kinase (ribokinase family)
MASETEPLDVLAIGELVVDFISHEMAHSLRTAGQFSRYLGGQPANVAVYVAKLGGRSAIITKLGAKTVILTRSGGIVTVSDNGSVERVGPLPKVKIQNVTGARDAFWSALLMAHLDGKDWPEAVRLAHEVASLKLRVEGHVERMNDRESLYAGLESAGQRTM